MEIEKIKTQSVKETSQADEQNSEHKANPAAPLPVVNPSDTKAGEPSPPKTEEETDRKQDESIASLAEQTEWIAKQTRWVKYQTIASSILGGITLGILVYHGMIMGKQSQVMIEQSRLMSKNLEDARETREIENRAWVGLKSGSLHVPIKNGPQANGVLMFENVGKTPAINCTLKISYKIGEKPEQLGEPNTRSENKVVIMPGAAIPQEFIIGLRDEEYEQVMKNRGTFYIWGIIEYDDIFGKHHKTNFCLSTDPESDKNELYACFESITFS